MKVIAHEVFEEDASIVVNHNYYATARAVSFFFLAFETINEAHEINHTSIQINEPVSQAIHRLPIRILQTVESPFNDRAGKSIVSFPATFGRCLSF